MFDYASKGRVMLFQYVGQVKEKIKKIIFLILVA